MVLRKMGAHKSWSMAIRTKVPAARALKSCRLELIGLGNRGSCPVQYQRYEEGKTEG